MYAQTPEDTASGLSDTERSQKTVDDSRSDHSRQTGIKSGADLDAPLPPPVRALHLDPE